MKFHLDEYTDYRLREWARWCQRGHDGGLGYPKTSTVARLFEGGVLLNQSRQRGVESHEAAEEIEKLLVIIAKNNLKIAKALRCYYLDYHLTCQEKARHCGLSYTQFRIYVGFACQWIAGWLAAKVTRM